MNFTTHDFIQSVRNGPFTSVGSYPVFWVTRDGSALSYEAVKENVWKIGRATRDKLDDGWLVTCCTVNWEDNELYCDETNERIPSAYAEED